MFVNRKAELESLEKLRRSNRPELVVVYGRRRVGKSGLILEFCSREPHLYFLASQIRERDNLDAFRLALLRARPDPVLERLELASWDAALTYLSRAVKGERFVLAIDEFPYLCVENPAVVSIFQKWWDLEGKNSSLIVILCGSHVSFMEREVLAERSPLFGRRTAQMRLSPLLPWEVRGFLPRWTPRDQLELHGILGGVPAYLERIDPARDLAENLKQEAFDSRGFLYDEVSFLLRTELSHTATYMSTLRAIAGGATRVSEIASKVGIPATSVMRYLQILTDLRLIRRDVPFTEKDPSRSKKGVYSISEPFVRFWFRFVHPHQALIEAGHGSHVWRTAVEPLLDGHFGWVFEEVCRTFVLHRGGHLLGGVPSRVGRLWGPGFEIDLLAEMAGGELLVGECKWNRNPAGPAVLAELLSKIGLLPDEMRQRARPALFTAGGFSPALLRACRRNGAALIDAAAIMRE